MRTLSPKLRSDVAKESIIRLCEANNLHRKVEKRRLDERFSHMLEDEPNLLHSGKEVHLRVTTTYLNVITRDDQQIIVQHEMPNVSFASSGDEDAIDFVAYVAKDEKFGRACFVLDCGKTAKNVLETIAKGFQQRTQHILNNTGTLKRANTINTVERFPSYNNSPTFNSHTIHFRTDSHDFITSTTPTTTTVLDPSIRADSENQQNESDTALTRALLEEEPWFHGSYLSREESETRLKQEGDFLVRESLLDPGSFVLSVVYGGVKLHLIFDSLKGSQVRTKELVFDNISALVKFHHEGGIPIEHLQRKIYLRNGVRPNPSRA